MPNLIKHTRIGNHPFPRIAAVGLTIISIILASNNAYSGELKVEKKENLISVQAKNVALEDVFTEIGKKFNIHVQVYPEMKKKGINIDLKDMTLTTAIENIVGGNYALLIRGDTVEALYILNKGAEYRRRNDQIERAVLNKFFNLNELKEIIKKVVLKDHPNAKDYDFITQRNLNGQVVSYVFTYYVGSGRIPDKKRLELSLRQTWEEREKLSAEIAKGYSERNSEKIIQSALERDKLNSKIANINDFISLQIGPSFDAPPIIAFWNGLPLETTLYPQAFSILVNSKKGQSFTYKTSYSIGLFSILFEFAADDGNVYYVDPNYRNMVITNIDKRQFEAEGISAELKLRNKNKWIGILPSF